MTEQSTVLELMDECEKLKEEADKLSAAFLSVVKDSKSAITTLTAENERLSARVARLEEALKPFNEFAELLELETEGFADDTQITVAIGNIADFAEFTFGDFRTARRELEEGK